MKLNSFKFLLSLFIANIVVNKINAVMEDNLIIDYFKMKYINQITMFACENASKYMNLLTMLMESNIYVSIRNINALNDTNIQDFIIKHGSHGFVLDADCNNSSTVLHQCADKELFFDKYKWLIFSTNETVLEILENTYMNVNAEITVASQESTGVDWNLTDVYNPGYKHGGTLKVNSLGFWEPTTGFILNEMVHIPKYVRRKDMSEISFKGVIIMVDKYPGELMDYLYNNQENKTSDMYGRFYFALFAHVQDIHNFSLEVTITPYFGSESKNGSFNGVVGALQRKEVDVGLTALFYKIDRSPWVDNLIPTYFMKARFLFLRPEPGLSIGGDFFTPLDSSVWLATWGVMLVTAVIIRLTFAEEWKQEREKNDRENYMEHDWSYIALLIFGGVCQQDVPKVPNLYSGRIIVFFSVFFTYMVYQFYSGGIVSSLLSDPPITIKNLQDLYHSDLKVGVHDIAYERAYFDETNDPLVLNLFNTKMKGQNNGSDGYYDEKTGMELVKKGGFAFQTDTSAGYAIIAEEFSNEEICELGEVQLYPNQWMGGVVQQDSPFREMFVYSFQRMAEAGIAQRQRLQWTTRKTECIEIVDSSTIFCSMKEFFPALLFYMVGIVITLIIFGAEIWFHRKIQMKTTKLIIIK